MFLKYKDADFPARDPGHGIHSGMFGVLLKEKADKVGAKIYLQYKGKTPKISHKEFMDSILIDTK